MTVLLPTDDLALYERGEADAHGWVRPPADSEPFWTGTGSLQLAGGVAAVDAASGGGSGPFAPAHDQTGTLYLPLGTGARDGTQLRARDRVYVLAQVRDIPDPSGGDAGCTVADVTEVGAWPQ